LFLKLKSGTGPCDKQVINRRRWQLRLTSKKKLAFYQCGVKKKETGAKLYIQGADDGKTGTAEANYGTNGGDDHYISLFFVELLAENQKYSCMSGS
jgi:cell division protein FtsI (penicillin-binding protein 3)